MCVGIGEFDSIEVGAHGLLLIWVGSNIVVRIRRPGVCCSDLDEREEGAIVRLKLHSFTQLHFTLSWSDSKRARDIIRNHMVPSCSSSALSVKWLL